MTSTVARRFDGHAYSDVRPTHRLTLSMNCVAKTFQEL
jgi:hypothetical protein